MNTKAIGDIGENKAVRFLKKKGFRIVDRNKHEARNEIDIVATNKQYVLFIEVKTRTVNDDTIGYLGVAASAVNLKKQARTITAARNYIFENSKIIKNRHIRFDVIEIYLNKSDLKLKAVNHIENAFMAK